MSEEINKKSIVLVDKAIENSGNDLIGIDSYVDSLKNAIEQGASIISINSQYGGGKSSICNLLLSDEIFHKKSVISLWDTALEKKFDHNSESSIDLMSFYKSLLFQLSADFNGKNYSKYINKALNEKTGFINLCLKRIYIWILFIFAVACLAAYQILSSYENLDLVRNILLVSSIILIMIVIISGGVVYSSWKSESGRLLTIDDITSNYVEIINDSLCYRKCKKGKKNIIILEDIDRCIDESNKDKIAKFITSVVKLLHYDCNNDRIKKKLRSVVLILCIDEQKLFTDNKNEELLLKLFDYRLDAGKVHHEDFKEILNSLLNKINLNDLQKDSLMLLLNSDKNSIRLIKKEVNDCLLKYNTLNARFPNNYEVINFNSCVAYSYLKNNFPTAFGIFIKNDAITTIKVRNALEQKNRREEIKIEIVDTPIEEKDTAKKEKIKEEYKNFNNKVIEFINLGYINEDFKIYFYNYPKLEKIKNVYENYFWNFLKGIEPLNLENNKKLYNSYVIDCANDMNKIRMEYPVDILFDPYILNILLGNKIDEQLLNLMKSKLQLNTDENISFAIKFINHLLNNEINYESISKYMIKVSEFTWNEKNILENEKFYQFRSIFTKLTKNNIIYYKNLFSGKFNSINLKEFGFINNTDIILQLINTLRFNDDLEDIFLKINYSDINLMISHCKFWSKNIISHEKYIEFATSTLSQYDNYDDSIISSLREYLTLLRKNNKFINYLNNIVKQSSREVLYKINNYNIDFGFLPESIDRFIDNNIGRTPLIYWLNNEMYEEILNCKISMKELFVQLLEDSFHYLSDKICLFKEYVLYCSKSNKFDYLFLELRFAKSWPVNINWNNVCNSHLLFNCNLEDSNLIVNHMHSKQVILTHEDIENMLNDIKLNPPFNRYIKSNLIIEIMNTYAKECQKISEKDNNILEQLINVMPENYKYKLIINYQIICKKLLPNYYYQLKNYSDNKDKVMYAQYINSLPNDDINIDLLRSINIFYPYNEKIINNFMINNCNIEVVSSYLLRKELWKSNNYIKLLKPAEIDNLIKYNDNFKRSLLIYEPFVNQLVDYGMINNIDDEFIISIIGNQEIINYVSLLKIYFSHMSQYRLEGILMAIDNIPDSRQKIFCRLLYTENYLINILKNNSKIYNHLYKIMCPAYKRVLTQKFSVKIQNR